MLRSLQKKLSYKAHEKKVNSMACNENIFVVVPDYKEALLWDLDKTREGSLPTKVIKVAQRVKTVAISPRDGTKVRLRREIWDAINST